MNNLSHYGLICLLISFSTIPVEIVGLTKLGVLNINFTAISAPTEIVQVSDKNYNLPLRCEGIGSSEIVFSEMAVADIISSQFYTENWELISAEENKMVSVLGGNIGENEECSDVQIANNEGELSIKNINVPNPIVQVFYADYSVAYRCEGGDCADNITLSDLEAGDYFVNVQLYDAHWQFICEVPNTPINISNNQTTNNCNNLDFLSNVGQIIVSGLTPSSKVEIIGKNTDWQVVAICNGDCAETEMIPNLTVGEYSVKVNLLGADGGYCYREEVRQEVAQLYCQPSKSKKMC